MSREEAYKKLIETLEAGGVVYIQTMTRITKATKKYIKCFKWSNGSMFMTSGKNWVCIDYCQITFEPK